LDALSQLDLAFCVDLTTSMTPFLTAARERMREILVALRDAAGANLHVGLVGYRDYGTKVELLEVHPFTADTEQMQKVLGKLKAKSPAENRDAAEAVFAGLQASVRELQWRGHSHRVLVLVGDAPPHACGATGGTFPDRFPTEDPTGLTLQSLSALLETNLITLYGLGMVPSVHPSYDTTLEEAFTMLSRTTGGDYRAARSSRDALAVVQAVGKRVFGELEFDRRLWRELEKVEPTAAPTPGAVYAKREHLQNELGASEHEINASVARLKRRKLMQSE